jgi:hypothetical protein
MFVEREINITENKIIIDFFVSPDVNFELCFVREYETQLAARTSLNKYLEEKTILPSYLNGLDPELSKRMLVKALVQDEILLPDNGTGYVFKGDKKHL